MPEYEALSYTWADENGDTSKCERAYIGKRWDILPITRNCHNALRRLRYSGRSRPLWVDAICINQSDVGERSHQVGIMQDIYATSIRVLIYLGEDQGNMEPPSSPPWNFDKWNTLNGRSLPAHKDLTQLSYFKRVWVIQEIAAKRKPWVLFGTHGDQWDHFLERVETKANKKTVGDPYTRRTTAISDGNQLPRKTKWVHVLPRGKLMDLAELPRFVVATADCEATDPRDKIFALLGLFQGAKQADLIADYSLSKEQMPRRAPGILAGELYRMSGYRSAGSVPDWAEFTDEVFQISGLQDHVVVLRPVASAPKVPKVFRFVAVAQQPKIDRLTECVNLINRRIILLFSTWQYVLKRGSGGELWFLQQTWDTIKAMCQQIKQFWSFVETTGRFSDDLEAFDNYKHLSDGRKIPHKIPTQQRPSYRDYIQLSEMAVRDQMELDACARRSLDTRELEDMKADDMGSLRLLGRSLLTSIYVYKQQPALQTLPRQGSLYNLREDEGICERLLREKADPTTNRDGSATYTTYEASFRSSMSSTGLAAFLSWELGVSGGIPTAEGGVLEKNKSDSHERKFTWIHNYPSLPSLRDFFSSLDNVFKKSYRKQLFQLGSLDDFVRSLLSLDLDQKVMHFAVWEGNNRMGYQRDMRRDGVIPWLHDFLNLDSDTLHKGGGRSRSYLNTWAADFMHIWALLTKGSCLNSPAESADPRPDNSEDQMEQGQDHLAAAKVKWAPLLDPIRETEAHLLPFEKVFVGTNDTHDEKMENVP
ncbi:heterokaryon incompatibility protein-domain-containing protein [Colletotrichum godetiae]|uniref:Heterokaryon incompatibility protein-domain-containing protein n=1 Tax=Colletotrichum godetiae TaxID=1209918 RepID=A0AAJ0ASU4_9PEZI|nr:heterokaryon incompatibility protein-domain-containing protein [Colletotrichum godetiae]KAK1689138.1 heterokaryon incompatibility protein-domain-containing protein [Colletotrichum godetiae]